MLSAGLPSRRCPGPRILAVLLAFVCALHPLDARAKPDHRPQDRFFFGLSVGSNLEDAPQLAGGFETSFWPNDWLAMGTFVTASAAGTYDVGGELMLAVPLRYLQPYGGVMGGLRTTTRHDSTLGVEETQVTRRLSLFAGVNAYASRNLRLFVEVRDLPDVTLIGDTHDALVLAGLRHSPTWFHRARGVTKVDTVWWSVLLTAALWTTATYAL